MCLTCMLFWCSPSGCRNFVQWLYKHDEKTSNLEVFALKMNKVQDFYAQKRVLCLDVI